MQRTLERRTARRPDWTVPTLILWVVAAFYAYGGLVHLMNMAGLSGFTWLDAPLKWQALDVIYLILDGLVVWGFCAGRRIGYAAFYIAAGSQIVLYTVVRAWIMDVPAEFARPPEDLTYLDGLVVFHLVSASLVTFAILRRRKKTLH
ncbi:MAG: hypothetical protein ACE363_12800 [Alphaproteobacteria bacterium]